MTIPTRILCALLLFAVSGFQSFAQSRVKDFPNDEEIKLLINQADRGMTDYEQLVKQESDLLGDTANISTDSTLVAGWKTMRDALRKDPQKFNSVAGFDFVTLIDDASRNAAVVSGSAATELVRQITSGKVTAKSDMLITLMQNATATGTLLYTVSESVSALYLKFLHWSNDTLTESVLALTKCSGTIHARSKNQ